MIKRGTRIIGWIAIVTGLLMSYLGCTRAVRPVAVFAFGESADGVVTSIREWPASSGAARIPFRQASVITFKTAAGEVITFEHPMQSSPPPYAQNEHVRVVYDADSPQDAVVAGGSSLLVLVVWAFVAFCGLVAILVGAVVIFAGALPWGVQSHAGETPAQAESPAHGAIQRLARKLAVATKGAGK